MDLSSYRREYSEWRTALESERYRYHAGLAAEPRFEPIRERYADLWLRESIDDLLGQRDKTPAQFEKERAGIDALTAAARLEHAEERTRDVTDELARCGGAVRVSWAGERVGTDVVRALLARETDAARRCELTARLSDVLRPCDDLRAARLESLAAAARALGLKSLRALHEHAPGADFDSLAARADLFLSRTNSAYLSQLSRWASREVPSASNALSGADEPFFERASWLDASLSPRGERALLEEVWKGLNVLPTGRRQIVFDDAERPGRRPHAACFGVRPPEEVFLVAGGESGVASSYLDTFFESGRALHFSWISADTAARYPEFVHAPEDAARAGFGFLFRGLFRDAGWVAERLGLRAADARALARGTALVELWDARRCCARLRWALALDGATDARSEQLAETYVSLHEEATGFRPDPATRLAEAGAAYGAAARLRGRLMAESLGEHLRERYGRRWHASRAAGGELIDLWNVGLRYSAEELARLAWDGALDFDLLADALTAPLQDND